MKKSLPFLFLMFLPICLLSQISPEEERIILKGAMAFNKGAYETAIPYFDSIIAGRPNHALPYIYKGRSHSLIGQYEAANAALDKAIFLNPFDPKTHFYRGLNHILRRSDNQAVIDFTTAVNLQADISADYLEMLGSAQFKMGDYAAAQQRFEEALLLQPKNPNLLFLNASCQRILGNKKGAKESLKLALEHLSGSLDKEDPTLRAQIVWEQGNADEALLMLDSILQTDSDNSPVKGIQAALFLESKNYKAALPYFEEQVILNPNDKPSTISMAYILTRLDSASIALPYIRDVVDQSPWFYDAWTTKGLAHLQLGQVDEALKALSTAVTLKPNRPEAFKWRSELHFMQGDMEQGCRDLQAAIDRYYGTIYREEKEILTTHRKGCK